MKNSGFILKLENFCLKNGLIEKGDRILIGVSGGPDSVALLHAMVHLKDKYQFNIVVAHLEHGIRGKESLDDMEFVREMSRNLGVKIYDKSVDIVAERKGGESLEEVARRVRYKFLNSTAEKIGCNKIALGHNLDDQVETIIYRIIRGTGPKGLIGMKPKRGNIIRPLLETRRREILQFLEKNSIPYRMDSTNYDIKYSRNRIRYRIVPEFEKIDPRYNDHIIRLSRNIEEDEIYLDEIAKEELEKIKLADFNRGTNSCTVKYSGFMSAPPVIRKRIVLSIFESIFSRCNEDIFYYNADIIQRIIGGSERPNAILYSSSKILVQREYDKLLFKKSVVENINREYLYIAKSEKDAVEIPEISKRLVFKIIDKTFDFDKDKIYLDFDKVKFPIIIRSRKPGDKINLPNLGEKKIKDIFINDKVVPHLRDLIPIIDIGGKVAGIFRSIYGKISRVSRDFMVDENTKSVLVCELEDI